METLDNTTSFLLSFLLLQSVPNNIHMRYVGLIVGTLKSTTHFGRWSGLGVEELAQPLVSHVHHEDRPFEISYNVVLKCEVKVEESISLNVRGGDFYA